MPSSCELVEVQGMGVKKNPPCKKLRKTIPLGVVVGFNKCVCLSVTTTK